MIHRNTLHRCALWPRRAKHCDPWGVGGEGGGKYRCILSLFLCCKQVQVAGSYVLPLLQVFTWNVEPVDKQCNICTQTSLTVSMTHILFGLLLFFLLEWQWFTFVSVLIWIQGWVLQNCCVWLDAVTVFVKFGDGFSLSSHSMWWSVHACPFDGPPTQSIGMILAYFHCFRCFGLVSHLPHPTCFLPLVTSSTTGDPAVWFDFVNVIAVMTVV